MKSVFTSVSNILKKNANINDTFNYSIKQYINPIDINNSSSIGEQIKHYRQLKGIQQKDVAKLLNIDRYTMYQIENKKYMQIYDSNHIKKIIEYLDIKDKIIWNDPYLEFIINDYNYKIKEFRIKYNLTQQELAELFKSKKYSSNIRRWESGETKMSRTSFNEFMDIVKQMEDVNFDYISKEYIDFIKNNPSKVIKDYISKEKITTLEFANRMQRNVNIINSLIKGKSIMTKKQYIQFKTLLDTQAKGLISSDPYINFIKSNPDKIIFNFLKKHKMSRAELSRQINVGRGTVERWVRKEDIISRKNYEILIDFMTKKNNSTSV